MKAVLKNDLNLLLAMMAAGVAHFVYVKGNGEVREAKGTLKAELIPGKAHQNAEKMHVLLTKLVELKNVEQAELSDFMADMRPEMSAKEDERLTSLSETRQLTAGVYEEVNKLLVSMQPKDKARAKSDSTLSYYDVEEGWRSFTKENFLGVIKFEQ